jgi:hypothetical protein
VIGATEEGLQQIDHTVRPLDLRRNTRASQAMNVPDLHRERFDSLAAMRERLASATGVGEQSLATDVELEQLAHDAPQTFAELRPGEHGSGLFIARHGADVLAALRAGGSVSARASGRSIPSEVAELLSRPDTTLADLMRDASTGPAAMARLVEDLVEQGTITERGRLVDDELYASVLDYVRFHRYAKLRHVREHLTQDVDLPTLRVALAFARRDLADHGL